MCFCRQLSKISFPTVILWAEFANSWISLPHSFSSANFFSTQSCWFEMMPKARCSADQGFSCEFGRTVTSVYFVYYILVNLIHSGKCKFSFCASVSFICSGLDCDVTAQSGMRTVCFCALERKRLPVLAVACPFSTVAAREQKSRLFLRACLWWTGSPLFTQVGIVTYWYTGIRGSMALAFPSVFRMGRLLCIYLACI